MSRLFPDESVQNVKIRSDSPELKDMLPEEGLTISQFPFVVGRFPSKNEREPVTNVDLKINDQRPYRLSRAHFSVVRTSNGFILTDSGSVLGTAVNGQSVGKEFPNSRVPLRDGENEIIAGGTTSPYKFCIVIEKKADEQHTVT